MRLFLIIFLASVSHLGHTQSVKEIDIEELRNKMTNSTDRFQVINFWASWCGPCIKELPAFQSLDKRTDVDVTLISLDFIQDIDRAKMALQKRDIKMDVFLLNAKNYIREVDKTWSGAIPATLIIDPSGKRYFYESAFTEKELQELINSIL